jgi:hypothetical protein
MWASDHEDENLYGHKDEHEYDHEHECAHQYEKGNQCEDEDEYDAANGNTILPICWLGRRLIKAAGQERPPLHDASEDLRVG